MIQIMLTKFKNIFKKLIKIIKSIYILILSPRILYHTLLKASDVLPTIENCTNQYGIFCGLINDSLYLNIKHDGVHEKHFVELSSLICKKNDVVIDLGANIGFHTITLSKLVTNGKVFSFEPQSLAFSILQNNILMNKCTNVVSFKFAISDRDHKVCSLDSYSYSAKEINTGALRISESKNIVGDLCLEKKLDSFNLPKINFIKIDAEGSEFNVLTGAKLLITQSRPIIFIEIIEEHLNAKKKSSKELIELILSYGYVLFKIKTTSDYICVQKNKVLEFEKNIINKFSYKLDKIS